MCGTRDAGKVARRDSSSDEEWAVYAQRLATTLRRARKDSGLSQEQLAYRAGLVRYTYQKYEKGESRPGSPSNPTLRTLLALSQVLGVPVGDLIPDEAPDLRSR